MACWLKHWLVKTNDQQSLLATTFRSRPTNQELVYCILHLVMYTQERNVWQQLHPCVVLTMEEEKKITLFNLGPNQYVFLSPKTNLKSVLMQ